MTPAEYRAEVLKTADAEGRLYPPLTTDPWARLSILMGMYMEGLIERRGDGPMYRRTGPWFATSRAETAIDGGKA
jgi:hypothetical protein